MKAQEHATYIGTSAVWQCCASLWRAAAVFYCSSQATDDTAAQKDYHSSVVAYFQAAASALEAFKKTTSDADGEFRPQALNLVNGLLDDLEAVVRSKLKQPLGSTNSLVLHYLRFSVAAGRQDTAAITSMLKAAAELPSVTARQK
eukprot:scaffold411028_cov43-Prasinocladus_malaysianus.AAC.1